MAIVEVFELNIVRYPASFNTFDSYGECLLKLGRKQEVLAAYERSLALNPEQVNAAQIVESLKQE